MNIAENIIDLIGNTPLIKLNEPSRKTSSIILAKCEFMNPGGSVKDRVGAHMLLSSLEKGIITKQTTIIEPTSGNTGIALASVAASLGMKLILTMPESMSIERRKLLKAYGAELVLTPAHLGMNGAINKAKELEKELDNAKILQQFENPLNPEAHSLTTAKEIWNDTDGNIDIFVAAVGTGGTLSGTAKFLKEQNENISIFAVEPFESAVLSGGKAAPHKIQGIGAGFIPKNLDTTLYQEVITVKAQDAIQTAKMIAKKEGLLVGISSGANVYAAMQLAQKDEFKGKTIVTILCDTAERYLSTELFDDE